MGLANLHEHLADDYIIIILEYGAEDDRDTILLRRHIPENGMEEDKLALHCVDT